MPDVVIYTSRICSYCLKAKELLDSKEVSYREVRVDDRSDLVEEAIRKSGGRKTVPQIFIDDYHVGGCDDLYELDAKGKLDELLDMPQ